MIISPLCCSYLFISFFLHYNVNLKLLHLRSPYVLKQIQDSLDLQAVVPQSGILSLLSRKLDYTRVLISSSLIKYQILILIQHFFESALSRLRIGCHGGCNFETVYILQIKKKKKTLQGQGKCDHPLLTWSPLSQDLLNFQFKNTNFTAGTGRRITDALRDANKAFAKFSDH